MLETGSALTNQGTLNATGTSFPLILNVSGTGQVVNSGTMQASNGGTLQIVGSGSNSGVITNTGGTV